MDMFLTLLCLWFALNFAIVAAMYVKPLRALRLFRLSRHYSSLAFARRESPICSGNPGKSHRGRYSQST